MWFREGESFDDEVVDGSGRNEFHPYNDSATRLMMSVLMMGLAKTMKDVKTEGWPRWPTLCG
jgi:hypothetical protein